MVVARGWESGRWVAGVEWVEFQFCKMKSSGDWLHNTVNILNAAELYI